MWRWPAFVLGVLALLAASASDAGCPIARSRYKMVHDKQLSAGFYPKKVYPYSSTDLAGFIHSSNSHQIYWFYFESGSAPYVNIYSTTSLLDRNWRPPDPDNLGKDKHDGPLSGMTIMFADRTYLFTIDTPHRRSTRPEYLLVRELPAVLAADGTPPEHPPLDFFKFDHCAAPGALDF